MIEIIMVLVGVAFAFGFLKFIPFAKAASMVLGIAGSVLLIGLALAVVGYPAVFNFIQGITWLYALVVGVLGGAALAALIPG